MNSFSVAQLIVSLLVLFNISNVELSNAQTKENHKRLNLDKLNKASGIQIRLWEPNRVGTYLSNVGSFVDFRGTGSAGMEWPVGSGNTISFASGLWLAGIKQGEVVTAASEFISEFQPGNVTNWSPGVEGIPADPNDERFRVYVIDRKDLADPFANPDYADWPVADGAPADDEGNPLLLGTSTAWAVFNDFDSLLHDNLFGSKVMGVEVQMTAWAFDNPNMLNDMMFFKFKFINKSGKNIDSTYAGFWADIDIGDIRDLTGSDSTLSLGFNYQTNADGVYGANAPAIGYAILQGPIVPSSGDIAFVSGREVPDFKNLDLTSFSRFDTRPFVGFSFEPETAVEAYTFLRGTDLFGDPFIDPTTGFHTRFPYSGDPVAGTGWIDINHYDKRFLMSSGPFTFADGDTQEVVLGIVIAQGSTGLESVALMKRNVRIVKFAYDTNFSLPSLPPAPVVTAYPDTASILLSWDGGVEAYTALDYIDIDSSGNSTSYSFQGYNVYQLDAPIIADETQIKRIAGFDVIDGVLDIEDRIFVSELGSYASFVVQNATDSGLQRFIRITRDVFATDLSLLKNNSYYFAVTSYGYNPSGVPKILESPLNLIEIRPQDQTLGTQLTTPIDDLLAVEHIGPSDGTTNAIVVVPTALTGQEYHITFRTNELGTTVWDVVTGGETKISGWKNQGALGAYDFPIIDGILVQVVGPHLGINTVAREFEGGPRWVSGTSWGGSHLFGGMDMGSNFLDFGSTLGSVDHVTVDWRFTSNATMSEQTGWSRAYVYRRDSDNAFAGLGWIPCQMYDVTDEANPRQLNICFYEDATEGLADGIWNPISAESAGGGSGGYEYLFCMLSDYNPDVGLYDDDNFGPSADVLYALWPNTRGSHPYQESDFTMRITPNFVNTERDTFRFKSEAPVRNDLVLAKQQAAALINVFPNPYNRGIINIQSPFDRIVTFTHLPETNTVIRIFSLAGNLVRKIEHDNGTQFDFWDLRNASEKSVASGFYIVHIDMGKIGVKVLKLAVL